MLLDTLGEEKAAKLVDKAIAEVTGHRLKSMSAGKMGYSTSEVGDMVAQLVAEG
jgi:3-isopropylmalate dehydrogenase